MHLIKVILEDNKHSHYFFKQFFHNIEIEDGIYNVHCKNGSIKTANGNIFKITESPNMDSIIRVENIVEILTDFINDSLRIDTNRLVFSLPLLIYIRNAHDIELSYKINVINEGFDYCEDYYLNAFTGIIIKSIPKFLKASVTGTVNTIFDGNQNIQTTQRTSDYLLQEDDRGPTSSGYIRTRLQVNFDITDNDNDWNENYYQRVYASVHWAFEIAYDYYWSRHQRRSYNDNDGGIYLYIDLNFNNSYWDPFGNKFKIGFNDDIPLAALDIIGHEFAHAVDSYSADLKNNNYDYLESFALKESIADMFGAMLEFYQRSNQYGNWIVGEEALPQDYRDLSNPWQSYINQPKTYIEDPYWHTFIRGESSQIFAYANMGVPNYWFYLLSEGGRGTNGYGNNYNVEGITKEEAIKIVYYALVNGYLISTSDFNDARKATLEAAEVLYGLCSDEHISVGDAWYAVGVGYDEPGFDYRICGSFYPNIPIVIGKISSIYAGSCLNPGDECRILSGADITCVAGKEIVLKSGFKAYSGSKFHAYFLPCNITYSSPRTSAVAEFIEQNIDYNVEFFYSYRNFSIFPNPTTGICKMKYKPVQSCNVNIVITDILGNNVKTILHEYKNAGSYDLEADLSSLPAGMYFVVFSNCTERIVQKLVKM